ncbi:hypothetical protein ABER99_20435 [Paenibacillus glucanolyticus]|uniref:Uncharacterized protein n=1 Tax=Paenibacillus glucanolyticus TaxID=59843 RepID=A0A163GHJ0_9BACL|nr:hypothetical protein [Paenibacillus glucanolyticus]KZS44977.1 hypothetical protein AWU65_03075 [Paenibacillus glucanolyticus]OMF64810.1 hypothetical protein BK142_31435 [Paenibacillus glucanolyticus]
MKTKNKFNFSSLLFWVSGLTIATYPIAFIIEKSFPNLQLFTNYNSNLHQLYSLFSTNILVFSALIVTIFFTGSKRLYVEVASSIRQRHIDMEVERWNATPYISPLHLYYMIFPPQAFHQSRRAQVFDYTYRYNVDHFRNRIFNNVNYTTFTPEKRPNLLKVIGPKLSAEITGYIFGLTLSFVIMAYLNDLKHWYSGWSTFLIPAQVFILRRIYYLMKAVLSSGATYKKIDRAFLANYGEVEPRIKWFQLFPNQRMGQVILDVWKKESEKRQELYDRILKRGTQGMPVFDCPTIPERPFTEDHIPEWANTAEEHYINLKDQQAYADEHIYPQTIKTPSKAKIISFEQHKRRKI